MKEKHFRDKIIFISGGVATENIYDIYVDPDFTRVYTRISIENLNNAMTELRVGVDHGGTLHQHIEQDSPAAATVYWIADPLKVFGSERLQVRITGATAGDRIEINTEGIEMPDEVKNA